MSEKKPSFGGILEAVRWAFEQQGIGAGETMVLVALATHADADGVCFPSVGRLAEMSKQSKPTVRRHLNRLERLNLIGKESGFRRDGSQSSNLYRLKPQRGNQNDTPPDQNDSPPNQIDTPGVQNEQGRVSESAPHEQPDNNKKKDSPPQTPPASGQGLEDDSLDSKEDGAVTEAGPATAANAGLLVDDVACEKAVAVYDGVAAVLGWLPAGWPLAQGQLRRLKRQLKDLYTTTGHSLTGWEEAVYTLAAAGDGEITRFKCGKSFEFLLGSGRLPRLMSGEFGRAAEYGRKFVARREALATPWSERTFDQQVVVIGVIGQKYEPEALVRHWRKEIYGPIEKQSPEVIKYYELGDLVETDNDS